MRNVTLFIKWRLNHKDDISMHESNEINWRTSREENIRKTEIRNGDTIKVHLVEIVSDSVEWTGSVRDLITGFCQCENTFTT